jgi:GTP pyrophosphokinase
MTGAKVNGAFVPFDHVLQNGDIVDIITSKSSRAPGDGLDCSSRRAAPPARKYASGLKGRGGRKNVAAGKEMFEAELNTPASRSRPSPKTSFCGLLKKLSVSSWRRCMHAIGYGGMTATRAVIRIRDELSRA